MMKTQSITNFDFLNFNLLKQGKVRSVYDLMIIYCSFLLTECLRLM